MNDPKARISQAEIDTIKASSRPANLPPTDVLLRYLR